MEKENQQLLLSDFDFYLPEELIAQDPLKKRDNSRLLIVNRKDNSLQDDYFYNILGAAHASLSVAKLWSASEVRKLSAWEGALPLPFPRFFEKNRVKLLILRTFLCHFNASADSYVSAKLAFR